MTIKRTYSHKIGRDARGSAMLKAMMVMLSTYKSTQYVIAEPFAKRLLQGTIYATRGFIVVKKPAIIAKTFVFV